ncbi:ABC transporter permease [Lachnospiraceae bacterium 29-91]
MTWPFENDTSFVVNKLANRNMKADKRSRLLLIFTIALSVCMVFSIVLISAGLEEKYKNTQRNKAQIGILGITDEQSARLHQNEDVLWIGEYSAIGLFYVEDKTITVAYGNKDYFLHQEEKTLQGNTPQKENEIMLPQNYIDYLGKPYQTGDIISLDLTGTGREAEYILSGILNDTKESDGYFIYVNKELARVLSEDTFQVTGYTRLNTKAISSSAILDFAEGVIQNTDIVKEQINLTEYFAVMSGAIKSGIPIPVPILAVLTAILAATIVHGVFYTKIVKNVQMFGQLRTIGMTKKQMKRMAGKEGRLYAMTGIPLGLFDGVLVGFAGCPDGFRIKVAVLYAVLIVAAAFVTVNLAIFGPVRVAMHTSPVEGTRYLVYTGDKIKSRRLHQRFTPFHLAKMNIQRNRKKAALTLFMLGMSGALLLVTSTAAGSIDPEKQANFMYYPYGNILIQIKNTVGSSFDKESEPYGSSKLQLEGNPLEDQALIQELETISGIEKITRCDCIYMTVTFPGGIGSITSYASCFPTLNREQIEEKQAVLSDGAADYDDMAARNGILAEEGIAKVGDTLKIEGRAPDGSSFEIESVVAGTYDSADLMQDSPVVPGSPYFIMTYDTAKKLTGITEQTGILAVKASDGCFQEVLDAVRGLAEQNGKIQVNTDEQTIVNIQYRYQASIKAMYMISVILLIFGSISLMNMFLVDFQNRKCEFGLFEAVGTTKKQLNKMLDIEIGIYLGGSLVISLLCGSIFSAIVCKRLDIMNHCITLKLPWMFLVALAAVLAVIYLLFSIYARSELKKTSILSAIRDD